MSVLKKLFGLKNNVTFKHIKKPPKGSKQYCLLQQKRATLNSGDFTESIKLPPDTDINDWYAANIVDFYSEIQIVTEEALSHCNEDTCPKMTAGPKFNYLWQDTEAYKSPTAVPAHKYIELLFNWLDNMLDDPHVFPPDSAVPFPKNFQDIVKQIFKRLFRVYAHVYYHHLEDIRRAELEPHFNTAFRHFYTFIHEFDLIPQKELEPLKQIIQSFSKK